MATIGVIPLFIAVKAGILTVPDAANPIPALSFAQSYVVVPPVLTVVKLTAVEVEPLHTSWLAG